MAGPISHPLQQTSLSKCQLTGTDVGKARLCVCEEFREGLADNQ